MKVTLQELGLRYQLGHGGGQCPLPCRGPSNFMVINISGVHRVSVDFCNCGLDGNFTHRRTQLLRSRWMPASFDRPQTGFTFNVLETFHELTLQGKTTAYDFYHTILRRTDSAQLGKRIVSSLFRIQAQRFNFPLT